MGTRLVPSGRTATRLLQAAIGVVLVEGLLLQNPGVVVNALLSLGVTFLPPVLARDWEVRLDTRLTLYIAVAVFLHSVGMLGFYESVWWYDHLTHTLSATVVAGVGYATAKAFDEHSDAVHFPGSFLALYVLLFTLALGVFWEVLEFGARLLATAVGMDPILFQYGIDDTLLDLVFNTAGAVLVALFGSGALRPLVESLTTRFDRSFGER
ncbi:hypothetical protein ACFO0N_09450 [Halobium salinum]|uniref:DUF2238 domain-containing protein n=1 Tax=Halobium salinum TaxID=1364940 RepID=A0ABD5PBX7_9EURY|nr:hypothetical protein [Halobium salinum]